MLLSLALPWLAGTLLVLGAAPAADSGWLLCAGYGYLLGAFATTLVMRALSLAGVRWSLPIVAGAVLTLAAALAVPVRARIAPAALRRTRPRRAGPVGADDRGPHAVRGLRRVDRDPRAEPRAGDPRRPLLPFDAWSQWATKAQVWFDLGRVVPFVGQSAWFAPGDLLRYTDMHPAYPPTVPLLQAWTGLWLGRWDESPMNAPWIALFVALGFAFHGQLRRAGAGPVRAMFFTYLLLSLPFLNVHVALAGNADLFVATTYGLAAIALWQWVRTRDRSDLALAVLLAIVCANIKVEGLLWALTLLPPALAAWNRRAGLALVAAVALAGVGWFLFGPPRLELFGYVLRTRVTNVSLPLAQHLFVMDNWHLLWYAALLVVAWRCRRLLLAPRSRR